MTRFPVPPAFLPGLLLSLWLSVCAVPSYAQATAEAEPTSLAPVANPTVSSPVTGITFADAPRMLPVDTRFSQAIQTVGFDVGLTCQQIEAYGWKIGANEQTRVNNIFGDTAEQLANLGYSVLPQNPGSAAADITVYTASKPGQDVLFTWSAGKAGLLLLLCDARGAGDKKGFGPAPGTVNYNNRADAGETLAATGNPNDIIGEWPGTYSCLGQGPAGGTLTISRVKADKSGYAVSGMFSFYPLSDKNPNMVRGSYRLAGRYDVRTHRALLEPGLWIQRPNGFSNAPLIAEFDTAGAARVSALFQGTTGCTSFEGNLRADSAERAASKAYDEAAPVIVATKAPVKKKKTVKKAAMKVAPAMTAPATDATAATTTTVTTTVTTPAVATTDVPGSTATTSPAAAATPTTAPVVTTVTTTSEAPAAPTTPAADTISPPSMAAPAVAPTAPAASEPPVTVPATPPAAQ